jgi:hypothetical protein
MQMVFGDGGELIGNFTTAIDVIGHEMTHAVTENTTPLIYFGQSGALNEHISDVFGIIIKQWKQNEDSKNADWLLGEECLLPGIKGVALRSMKAPSTAYDDPKFVSVREGGPRWLPAPTDTLSRARTPSRTTSRTIAPRLKTMAACTFTRASQTRRTTSRRWRLGATRGRRRARFGGPR